MYKVNYIGKILYLEERVKQHISPKRSGAQGLRVDSSSSTQFLQILSTCAEAVAGLVRSTDRSWAVAQAKDFSTILYLFYKFTI